MFGRGLLLSTLLLAVIFVSTLDAKKCNNFQLKKSVKNLQEKSGVECSACTGYICKIDGKNILGTACTEDVKEICQQNWDDSKLESIAKEKKYQSEKGKYFVFSCQENYCNKIQWLTDISTVEYAKEIAASDLSFDSIREQRFKRNELEYSAQQCATMTEKKRKEQQILMDAKAKETGNYVRVCPDGVGGGLKKNDDSGTVKLKGKLIYSPKQCPTMTEKEKKIKQAEVDDAMEDIHGIKTTVCPGGVGGGAGAGAEAIGYGIGVIVATLGSFFFY